MDEVSGTPDVVAARESASTTERAAPAAAIDEERRWYVSELLLMLELGGLAAFAFGRPVLDAFGRSPDTFVARGADTATIVLFGVIVVMGPYLVLGLLGLLGRPFGSTVRRRAHIALVAVLGGFAVWQIVQGLTGYPPESNKAIAVGVAGGLALGLLRSSVGSSASFLRFVGAASVVFLVQFLFMSPTSGLVTGDGPAIDDEVARQVAADLGDDPPDVVVMVFDALPTMSLLDGEGEIDADLFPNFAALSGEGTWYRNNTSVAAFTADAVPSLLTGRYPDPGESGATGAGDGNLFTLLGDTYDVHAREQITRLCPVEMCSVDSSDGTGALLGDAVDLWTNGAATGPDDTEFRLAGLNERRLYDEAVAFVDELALDPGGPPDLVFHHMMLPHEPWRVTDDGTYYDGGNPPTGFFVNGWTDSGYQVGRQRHLLQVQAADRLLGRHLDALREAGMYDDSLVVVTADHGASFVPDTPSRGLAEENYEQIMWTPLIVKAPGRAAPGVDDRDVRAVDVLPTVADLLGVDLPWEADGAAIGQATGRDGRTKPFADHELNTWRPEGGGDMLEVPVGDAFDRVLATDPVPWSGPDAVWKRTVHGDLLGRPVDDLTVGADAAGTVAVEGRQALADVALDEPLPLEVVGRTDMAPGTFVAYALNGAVGGVSVVEDAGGAGDRLVHAIVPPRLFREGGNELTAYVVEGPVGSETLREVRVVDAG